jgi:chromosome partitioning protein
LSSDFGFDLLPANRELAGAEIDLIDIGQREYRLRDALAEPFARTMTSFSWTARRH